MEHAIVLILLSFICGFAVGKLHEMSVVRRHCNRNGMDVHTLYD